MCGNVSEWVVDQYVAGGYRKLVEKLTDKKISWLEAVVFPTKIFPCVVRGGNWASSASGAVLSGPSAAASLADRTTRCVLK